MINKSIEIRKPSELCQVLYYNNFTKKEPAILTSLQVDLVDVIFKFIATTLEMEKVTDETMYDWISLNHFEINLQDIASLLRKYDNNYYAKIVSNLTELAKVQVLSNTLHKNKSSEMLLFHFIRKISWVQDKKTTNKKIKLWVEPDLIKMFLNLKNHYTEYSLQIQFGMNSKYSKLLYPLTKDYNGVDSKTIDFELLQQLLNVDVITRPNLANWSHFNRDLLKRTVKEINEKSDIILTYTPIKERDENNKLKVTKVKFDIKKQKSILLDYSIADTTIIEEVPATRAEIKLEELAQQKMSEARIFGTVIKNEKRYKATVIDNLIEEGLDIESIIELEDYVVELKESFLSVNNNKNQLMVLENYEGHLIISISNDFLLYSPVDKVSITKTAKETISRINNLKQEGILFTLRETDIKVSGLEFSYL